MSGPTPSPCTQVCQMDSSTGWCRGCARSLDEIAGWGAASEPVKRAIVEALPARRAELRRQGLLLGTPAPQDEAA